MSSTPVDNLICVGLDHTTSDRPLRLLVAIKDKWAVGTMRRARKIECVTDVLVLSTCNRVEIYVQVSPQATAAERSEVTQKLKGLLVDLCWHRSTNWAQKLALLEPDLELVARIGLDESDLYKFDPLTERVKCFMDAFTLQRALIVRTGADVAAHVIDVSMGLASAIVGDEKVLDQVKLAHKQARKSGHLRSGSALDRVCRVAVDGGTDLRRTRRTYGTKTTTFRSRASTAGFLANIDADALAHNIDHEANVLIIGAGDAAVEAAVTAAYSNCTLTVCAKQSSKAHAVAVAAKRAHAGRESAIRCNITCPKGIMGPGPYDVIIVTETVEGAHLSALEVGKLAEQRANFHAQRQLKGEPSDLGSLSIIDLTDGNGIDSSAKKLAGVSWWDTGEIDHHFGTSIQWATEEIAQARWYSDAAKTQVEALGLEQAVNEQVKQRCLELDRMTRTQIAKLKRDETISAADRKDITHRLRRYAAQQKHQVATQMRSQAGLPTRSRTLLQPDFALCA